MNETQIEFNGLILKEMQQRVVSIDRIEYNDKGEPVDRLNNQLITLRSDFVKGKIPEQSEKSKNITAWDVLKKKKVKILAESILKFTTHEIPEEELYTPAGESFADDESQHLQYVNTICEGACECIDELGDDTECPHSREELIDMFYKYSLVELELMRIFKKTDVSKLRCHRLEGQPNIEGNDLEECRKDWMNFIRKHRVTAFEELDQLEEDAKKEGSSEDDLADIDTIKQMFRDIPQDTDLSQYKTLDELMEFWPSLLLPKPFPGIKPCVHDRGDATGDEPEEVHPDDVARGQLLLLLSDVDDIKELQSLLKDVKKQGTDSVPEYTIPLLEDRIEVLKNK